MNFKRITSIIYSLICLLGLMFQVQQVSELYFHFYTTSKTVFRFREVDYYQTIMYCPRLVDLLNRSSYQDYSIGQHIPQNVPDVYKELSRLTIRSILELTPPASDVIKSCIVRHGRLATPLSMNQRDCKAFFKVIKSVNGERVCYTFIPRIVTNYSSGDVSSSESWTNVVYNIYLNPSIVKTTVAIFISSVIDPQANEFGPDLNSRPYHAKVVNSKTFNVSGLQVSGESTEINRMALPYDTKCIPGHGRETCYEHCLQNRLKIINRLPWSGFYREAIDMKMLTALDLKNKTTSEFAEKSFEECYSLCKVKAECVTQFSRTIVQDFRSHYRKPFFASMASSLPHLSLYAVPFLTLIEYVVQLGSCFGIWFGLSIFSMNPVKMLRKKSNTNRVICHCHKRSFLLLSNKRHR